jgi:hypothetical protein
VNYIDWVELVCRSFADVRASSDNIVGWRELLAAMGLPEEANPAAFAALADLHELGMLDNSHTSGWIRETQNTRAVRGGASIRDLWPEITHQSLDEEQLQFLKGVIAQSEQPRERWADLDEIQAREVFAELGWEGRGHLMYDLSQSLASLGLIEQQAAMGDYLAVRPTYRGIVLATQGVTTEWWLRIEAMVKDWETTTVEFKERITLGTAKTNAEFAHDIIALANTKASGRDRHLIVGYNDRTRTFETPVDGVIDQNRLEQILNAFSEPAPEVRHFTVDHPSGTGPIGVIEVHRDATKLPHRMKRGGGKIAAGKVFVRHGSQVEEPTAGELTALQHEGDEARIESALPGVDRGVS